MKIHYLQHVDFEGLAYIQVWANNNGHQISSTKLYLDEEFPEISEIDLLLVMGGPMNIYEYDKYPWLVKEKKFLQEAIVRKVKIVGICLGSQLLADVLGARVFRNPEKEIGWFDCFRVGNNKFTEIFPERFPVFHWHGDTFSIPVGAINLFKSDGCENQGFIYGDNVLALQFHLEVTPQSIEGLIENGRNELQVGRHVQNEDYVMSKVSLCSKGNSYISNLLDCFVTKSVK